MSTVPGAGVTAFVIGKDIDHDNNKFRIVISSLNLLALMNSFDVLAADCTFKTTLQGYPLLVVCIIDAMRHAHPVALVCMSHQQVADYEFAFNTILQSCAKFGIRLEIRWFLSDGEVAMKNAARNVFANCKTINCYFHVVQNVKKHLLKSDVPAVEHGIILQDISQLQVAPTNKHFKVSVEMFREKHQKYPVFAAFFEKYLTDKNYSGWNEAFAPGVPSTNNAVEAINKALKYNFLNRRKEPFGTFKIKILEIIESYGDPSRSVQFQRTHSLKHERQSFDFLREGLKLRSAKIEGEQLIFVSGHDITAFDISRFQHPKYTNFEEFELDMKSSIYRINVSNEDFRRWNCTCYCFFKENTCKHILAVAVQRKKMVLKPEANTLMMSRKKSAGRPKHSSKALVID